MRAAWVLLSTLPALASAQDGGSREALYTALALNECAVTEDETTRVFGLQGFDPEYVRHELGQMVLDESAFLERGYVLRVNAEHCPPDSPVPTPAQALRQAIADRGCSIDDEEARAMAFNLEWMRPVVLGWIESGTASVEWNSLTLTDCG